MIHHIVGIVYKSLSFSISMSSSGYVPGIPNVLNPHGPESPPEFHV